LNYFQSIANVEYYKSLWWGNSDNYAQWQEAMKKGLSPQVALNETWAGKVRSQLGFTRLVSFVMGYLYTMQFDAAAAVPVLDNRFQISSLKNLESARIDTSIFSSEQYKALRVFGSLPVVPGTGGKDNPFR
jgi:hypothetical protein